jgi:hypothetical protein
LNFNQIFNKKPLNDQVILAVDIGRLSNICLLYDKICHDG